MWLPSEACELILAHVPPNERLGANYIRWEGTMDGSFSRKRAYDSITKKSWGDKKKIRRDI